MNSPSWDYSGWWWWWGVVISHLYFIVEHQTMIAAVRTNMNQYIIYSILSELHAILECCHQL